MELSEKSVVWKHLYKFIHQGVQENIVILNVTIFCVQTKVFGNIKFRCPIVTPFCELNSSIFFSSLRSKDNTEKFLKVPHECRS